jgi:preprotein translocase subunit Sss1
VCQKITLWHTRLIYARRLEGKSRSKLHVSRSFVCIFEQAQKPGENFYSPIISITSITMGPIIGIILFIITAIVVFGAA